MKIIVTGLEVSGTKWMTELLSRHPDVSQVIHTSIPEYLTVEHGFTRWPELNGADFVVWMLRYEPLRLKSVERNKYNAGRLPQFLPPALYDNCVRLYNDIKSPVVMVSYSALVGPLGKLVFRNSLERMGLDPAKFPEGVFHPLDANAKYCGPA